MSELTTRPALPRGFVVKTMEDVYHAEAAADAALGIRDATQGKCEPCGRFLYFSGPLHRARCPRCERPLSRTSRENRSLPRLIIVRSSSRQTSFAQIPERELRGSSGFCRYCRETFPLEERLSALCLPSHDAGGRPCNGSGIVIV